MNKGTQFLINTGISHLHKNKLLEAELCFKEALKDTSNLSLAYSYLIPVLIQQSKDDEAYLFNQNFLRDVGESENYYIYDGILNLNKNFLGQALKSFKNVLKINSNNYDALVNMGVVLNKMILNQDAMKALKKAIVLNPNKNLAYQNIGKVYEDEGEYQQAINHYKKALEINPQDFETIHNLSLAQLAIGDFVNGWNNYDLRWKKRNKNYKYAHIPNLESLNDINEKKILIWCEQGLGDTIQFSRYVDLLITKGAEVTFEVQGPLANFFKNNFDCEIIDSRTNKKFDFQLPLLSLPKLFGMTLENTLKLNKYLKCKIEKKNFWLDELSLSSDKLNIGIAISGNPKQASEYRRKIDLINFVPLLKYSKIYLVQKEIAKEQEEILLKNKDIIFLGDNKNWENFDDTSAIIDNLDIVISVCTSIVHLSGAMNKKTILLLSKPADWRWGLNEDTSPKWYESVEIIRQNEIRRWDTVLDKLENKIIQEYQNKILKINYNI